MSMAYDHDNIFAKILRAEIPCYKVYEDEKNFAFLDIFPRTEGHTLVIPKSPARTLMDISREDLASLIGAVQAVARGAMRAFEADGLTVQQFNEAAGGQEVFHLHYHILPRFDGLKLKPPGQAVEEDSLAASAEKLRTVL